MLKGKLFWINNIVEDRKDDLLNQNIKIWEDWIPRQMLLSLKNQSKGHSLIKQAKVEENKQEKKSKKRNRVKSSSN